MPSPRIAATASCLALAALGCRPTGQDPGQQPGSGKGDSSSDDVDAGFEPAPHRPLPLLISGGGPVLAHARIITLVAENEDPAIRDQLFAYSQVLVTSSWISAIGAEYGVGSPAESLDQIGPAIAAGTIMDQAALRSFVATTIATSPELAPDGRTLYLLFLPDQVYLGSDHCHPGTDAFHLAYGGGGDALAIVDRCTAPSWPSVLERLTVVAGHEIAEALTDPNGETGWGLDRPVARPWEVTPWLTYDSGPVENGDLCIGTRTFESGLFLQRAFSNAAASAGGDPCVPALAEPYFNATTPNDWYEASPGETISIPVMGWSTAATADWSVASAVFFTSDATVTYGRQFDAHDMQNGTTRYLAVTVPPSAQTDDYAVFAINSTRMDDPGDYLHLWLVGVHVVN